VDSVHGKSRWYRRCRKRVMRNVLGCRRTDGDGRKGVCFEENRDKYFGFECIRFTPACFQSGSCGNDPGSQATYWVEACPNKPLCPNTSHASKVPVTCRELFMFWLGNWGFWPPENETHNTSPPDSSCPEDLHYILAKPKKIKTLSMNTTTTSANGSRPRTRAQSSIPVQGRGCPGGERLFGKKTAS